MASTFQVGFSSAVLEPGIRKYFQQGMTGDEKTIFDKYLNVETSEKRDAKYRSFPTLGAMASMSNGGDIPADTLVDGYATTISPTKYGKVVGIDKESWDDDLYDVIKKLPTILGRSVRVTKEIVAAGLFNAAFSTALSDGVALISALHPLAKAGGTTSNVLGTPADPSYSTWAGLNALLITQKDGAGQPMFYLDKPKIWMVHPDFYDVAVQAVNSGTAITVAGAANTNSGIINPWSSGSAGSTTVLANPYLTDLDASFLFVAPGSHEARLVIRKDAGAPKVWDENNPEVVYAAATMRLGVGAADWRGFVGTAGA